MQPEWSRIATGPLAHEIEHAILGIVDYLKEQIASSRSSDALKDPSLGGSTGFALFFHYLAPLGICPEAEDLASVAIAQSQEGLLNRPSEPSLFSGFLGTTWLLEHLDRSNRIGGSSDLENVDSLLQTYVETVSLRSSFVDFDLISGLAGTAVYLIERLPSAIASRALGTLAKRFEASACRISDAAAWETPGRGKYPWNRYDLGLAHGSPGVIQVLSQMSRLGIEQEMTRRLALAAIRFLRQKEISDTSRFPAVISAIEESNPSRLAWCYGDAGIAGALLVAGQCLRDEEIVALAIDIAKHAASRTFRSTGVIDESFCHGSAGLAHVFNRFFAATRMDVFAEASIAWYRQTLQFSTRPGHLGLGYLWKGEQGEFVRLPGFLQGASGVGLALIAAISDIEPAWDRLLLLSFRNPSGLDAEGHFALQKDGTQ